MKSKDERETPPELFAALDAEFHFTLDACASASNAKLSRYFTEDVPFDSQGWTGECVWCNPPFSEIGKWVKKAWDSKAACVVMLIPANRTEQPFWQQWVEPYRDDRDDARDGWGPSNPAKGALRLRVRFLAGRTRFLKDGVRMGSPNFSCVLLVWSDYPESK